MKNIHQHFLRNRINVFQIKIKGGIVIRLIGVIAQPVKNWVIKTRSVFPE